MAIRYVVAKYCFAGIGDHLVCLMGAWWLARRTGRTLVIDWRGSRFNTDPGGGRNCFQDYFHPQRTLAGVDLIADDQVAQIDYPTPVWPEKWTSTSLAGLEHRKHTANEIADVNRMVHSSEDPPQPTIVLNGWVEPMPPREPMRMMLNDLRASAPIRDAAQQFWDAQIGSRPAVAIHLRHGNGENVGYRAAYWLSPTALVRQFILNARNDIHRPGLFGKFSDNAAASLVGTPGQADAERRFCRRVANEFHALARAASLSDAAPFLFCDSGQIIATMREELPGLVVCPKRLLKPGDGPLHQFDASSLRSSPEGGVRSGSIADEITREMFVELELMRRCAGLLYMDSGFSILSRTLLDDERALRLEPSLMNRLITKVARRLEAH